MPNYTTLFFLTFRRNLKGNPLFSYGRLDEQMNGSRHADADGVAEFLEFFF